MNEPNPYCGICAGTGQEVVGDKTLTCKCTEEGDILHYPSVSQLKKALSEAFAPAPEPPPAERPTPQTIDDLALSFAFEIYNRGKIELASEFFQIAPEVRMTFKQFIARLIRFHGEAKERGL